MEQNYTHKQTGSLMTGIVLVALIWIFFVMSKKGVQPIFVLYLVVLGSLGLIFSSMTVTVADDYLTLKFGLGVIRKKVRLSDIESCLVVKNPWYYGWGIRRIPRGWLYSVSGQGAVEVRLKNGRRIRIGSDDPEGLDEAIRRNKGR